MAAKRGGGKPVAGGKQGAKPPVAKKSAAKGSVAKKASPKKPGPAPKPPRPPGERRYFLVKTEPEVFSFDDLLAAPDRTTSWDGVRNYQARNTLRDDMQPGDGVLVHHSNADPPAIVGIAEVVRAGYPDHTQFDPAHDHYDPGAKPEAPTWFMVDLRAVRKLPEPLPLDVLKRRPALAKMVLLQKGSRLSVQPVTADEWKDITGEG